jgi:outer membrane protein assembly factor BamB
MRYHIASSFLVLTLIGTTGAGEIYTPHARHTQLGTIDPNTGVGTNIGSFQQPDLRLASGAFDNDRQFYSIALLPGNTDSQLARVDTSSGEATLIGSSTGTFAVPLEVSGDGTMYTVGYLWPGVIGDNTNLFTVNKTDGQLTAVGPTEVTRPMDLAFDSQGTLWLVSGGDDGNHLYTLNPATGEATLKSTIAGVEEATEPGAELMGIMFDEHDTLFGTAYYGANADFVSPLFNIDPASGMATVIGNTGFVNPHGGDYLHAVPEPTSAVLSLLGSSICCLVRRHRRV